MPSQSFTGIETVSTTEWSLTTDTAGPDVDTTAGTYELWLDVSAMALGDRFEIKRYEKISGSGGTQRQVGPSWVISHDAGPHLVIYLGMLMHGWDVTIKKLSGTDRSIEWSIRKA